MSAPVRVLIADDHAVVREGLRMFLAESDEVEVVAEAADGVGAVEQARAHAPDVILMDLLMPGMDGIEALRRIQAAGVPSRVLILTTYLEDEQVREAVQAGATGYLLKDVMKEDLLDAIRAAARGRATLHPEVQHLLMRHVASPGAGSPLDGLTARETDVLRLLARGRSNKQIATALFLSLGTVKGHVSAILAKLGVQDRTQAALLAARHGLAED
ncbi:MAG TPA: response regulator transcription factor [Longimicrobium sp.]|nr:response regulator transcription factor [Longimicrobium sp.]